MIQELLEERDAIAEELEASRLDVAKLRERVNDEMDLVALSPIEAAPSHAPFRWRREH